MKYKEPGYPTISIFIRDQLIYRALFDIEASVNLILFTEYEKLGLGELKPTKMEIQFADRSTRLLLRMSSLEWVNLFAQWTLLELRQRRYQIWLVKSL